MKLLILGENSLLKLTSYDKSIFSTFPYLLSIYAYQLAALTPKKHSTIVPTSYENINFDENYDAVFINFKTGTAQRAYMIADKFKQRGLKIILSGSHPSALPMEAKQHCDSVIIGNAENHWSVIINDLEKNNLKNIYQRNEKFNHKSLNIPNILKYKGSKILGAIEATRGCPYQCDFCQESNIPQGSIFRTRPVEEVINEIKTLPQKYILFCDVSMTIDPTYTSFIFLKRLVALNGQSDLNPLLNKHLKGLIKKQIKLKIFIMLLIIYINIRCRYLVILYLALMKIYLMFLNIQEIIL
jgi:radical SAM superfamily enzyme YgiQ (UPF0313 family)